MAVLLFIRIQLCKWPGTFCLLIRFTLFMKPFLLLSTYRPKFFIAKIRATTIQIGMAYTIYVTSTTIVVEHSLQFSNNAFTILLTRGAHHHFHHQQQTSTHLRSQISFGTLKARPEFTQGTCSVRTVCFEQLRVQWAPVKYTENASTV